MANSTETLELFVRRASDVLTKCGNQILLPQYAKDVKEKTKKTEAGDSTVTSVDTRANRFIRNRMQSTLAFSELGYVSEEGYNAANYRAATENGLYILVDPLDGTRDFKKKTGNFTSLASLIDGKTGTALAGVIYKPTTQELYTAIKGKGAYKTTAGSGRQKLQVSQKAMLDEAIILTSMFHKDTFTKEFFEKFKPIGERREVGSGGNKLARVASNEGDIYIHLAEREVCIWDTAAGNVILSEAGGKITDTFGNELSYNGKAYHEGGILATNAHLHEQSLVRIQEIFKQLAKNPYHKEHKLVKLSSDKSSQEKK